MFLYLFEANNYDYDEYDSTVVIAESFDSANAIVEQEKIFYPHQKPIKVTIVGEILGKNVEAGTLISSFNDG